MERERRFVLITTMKYGTITKQNLTKTELHKRVESWLKDPYRQALSIYDQDLLGLTNDNKE